MRLTGNHRLAVERCVRKLLSHDVDAEEDLERSERSDVGDINHRNDQSSRGSFEEAKEKRFHVEFWILFDFFLIMCYILLR